MSNVTPFVLGLWWGAYEAEQEAQAETKRRTQLETRARQGDIMAHFQLQGARDFEDVHNQYGQWKSTQEMKRVYHEILELKKTSPELRASVTDDVWMLQFVSEHSEEQIRQTMESELTNLSLYHLLKGQMQREEVVQQKSAAEIEALRLAWYGKSTEAKESESQIVIWTILLLTTVIVTAIVW